MPQAKWSARPMWWAIGANGSSHRRTAR
jgi:hypothetical protein